MNKRIIEHTLRTITLEYDDSKTETDYEKEILKSYIQLHDSVAALIKQSGKLRYEYMELEDAVTQANKIYMPFADAIESFLKEGQALKIQKAESGHADDLMNRLSTFLETLSAFHADTLTPLTVQSGEIQKEYIVFSDADDKLEDDLEHHDTTCQSLYSEFEKYALDLVSYDDDEQGLKEEMEKLMHFSTERDRIIEYYNSFMNSVSDGYSKCEKVKALLGRAYDDTGMLDSSLSDSYADGTGDPKKKPIYLLQPGDEGIQKFKNDFGLMAHSSKHTITMDVPVEVVQKQDVFYFQDIIARLQHFPGLIEKYIFAFDIKFLDTHGIAMPPDEWKGYAHPMRWLNKLNSLPCAIFFIHDYDARGFALMGDLIADNKLTPDPENGRLMAEGEVLEEICSRLITICWFFHLYCHNSGFNPQVYIEALMAEFDTPATYEQVRKMYEESVAQGIELRMKHD